MAKWRKKPVIVDAWQWKGATLADAHKFCEENGLPEFSVGSDGRLTGLVIPTLEGNHYAITGDFIIRGVKGEYYPCKPDIFKATYEPAE
jgi:hypothetical protein